RDRRPANVPHVAHRVPRECTASAVPAGDLAGSPVARVVPAAPEGPLVAGRAVRHAVDRPVAGAAARWAVASIARCRREAPAPAGGARSAPPVRGARWVVDPQVSFVGGPSAVSSVLSTDRAAQTTRAAPPGECGYSRASLQRGVRWIRLRDTSSHAPPASLVTTRVTVPYSVDGSSNRVGSPSWMPCGVLINTVAEIRPARNASMFTLR